MVPLLWAILLRTTHRRIFKTNLSVRLDRNPLCTVFGRHPYHPMINSTITITNKLSPPTNWIPPSFSLSLCKKYNSPFYGTRSLFLPIGQQEKLLYPRCHGCTTVFDIHLPPRHHPTWWHPYTNLAWCCQCVYQSKKDWFFTAWLQLHYTHTLWAVGCAHTLRV